MLILDNIIFSAQRLGGISVLWYELLKRLLNDSRFDCRFLEYPGGEKNLSRKLLDIPESCQLPAGFPFPAMIQSRLLPHIRLKDKALFHSSYYRILKDKNACNITTVHDFIYEKYATGIRRSLHIWQKSRAILNSQAIICVSQNTRNDLFSYFPNLDPKRVRVVYNGVSGDFCIDPSADAELPFPSGSYLLFVGARKGYKNFLPAVRALQNTGVDLIIAGGPDLTEEETAALNQSAGKGHYRHLKGISNSMLNILYNHALALLYPSAYEGFGIPIVEAQKAGCPVICQNTEISREIAADGALFFSEFSEIPQLIERAVSQKNVLLPAGLKNAQRFSWDNTYEQTTEIYQQLMNE